MKFMIERYIDIHSIEQMQRIFGEWFQLDGVTVEVHCGRYCVDGHSILGLMSLDYTNNIVSVVYSKESDFTADELDHIHAVDLI